MNQVQQTIEQFLADKQQKWLDSKLKGSMSETEKEHLFKDARDKFFAPNWIKFAAPRAKQLTLATHVAKFSHPNAKVSSIVYEAEINNQNYIQSGSTAKKMDVFGNAAALDVYQFLMLEIEGKVLLNLFEEANEPLFNYLDQLDLDRQSISNDFLAIKKSDFVFTDSLVKQVYFPVEENTREDYHTLSTLTSSALLFQLKKKIQDIQYGRNYEQEDTLKKLRKARRENTSTDGLESNTYSEFFNLTSVAFGGTKPQNISSMNSVNGGSAILLSCLPPTLEERKVRLPKNNFFLESLSIYRLKPLLESLHLAMKSWKNNVETRERRVYYLENIVYDILYIVWHLRQKGPGWTKDPIYAGLPKEQKKWLDSEKYDAFDHEVWSGKIINTMTTWIIQSYKKIKKKDAFPLSDTELMAFKVEIEELFYKTQEIKR